MKWLLKVDVEGLESTCKGGLRRVQAATETLWLPAGQDFCLLARSSVVARAQHEDGQGHYPCWNEHVNGNEMIR